MTGYAPLDADPASCGFCGAVGGPDGVLVTVGQHGGAICEECAVRLAEIMTVDEAAIRAEYGELDLGLE